MSTDKLNFSFETLPVPQVINPTLPNPAEEGAEGRGFRDVLSTSLKDDPNDNSAGRAAKNSSGSNRSTDSLERARSADQDRPEPSSGRDDHTDSPRASDSTDTNVSPPPKKETSVSADDPRNAESTDAESTNGASHEKTQAVEGAAPAEFVAALLPAEPPTVSSNEQSISTESLVDGLLTPLSSDVEDVNANQQAVTQANNTPPPGLIEALATSTAGQDNKQIPGAEASQPATNGLGENVSQAAISINNGLATAELNKPTINEEQATPNQGESALANAGINTKGEEQQVAPHQIVSEAAQQSQAQQTSLTEDESANSDLQNKAAEEISSSGKGTSGKDGEASAKSAAAVSDAAKQLVGGEQSGNDKNTNSLVSAALSGNALQETVEGQHLDISEQVGRPSAAALQGDSSKTQGDANSTSGGEAEEQQTSGEGNAEADDADSLLSRGTQATIGTATSSLTDAQVEVPSAETENVSMLGATPTGSQAGEIQSSATGGAITGGATVDVNQPNFMDRVAQAVQTSSNNRQQVTLRLTPPELGTLQIEIAIDNGTVSARLETQTASARRILTENLPQLKEALAQHGATVERVEVFLADNSPNDRGGETGNHFTQQGGQGDHPAKESSSWQPESNLAEAEELPEAEIETEALTVTPSGIRELDVMI